MRSCDVSTARPLPFAMLANAVFLLVLVMPAVPGRAAVIYSADDGTAEDAFGFVRDPGDPPTHDVIFLNRFAVASGGQTINAVQIAFGGPGGPASYNGRAIQVLLYEDANGGSTTDAVLRQSVPGVTAGANTSTFINFALPTTQVNGTFLVGFLARNQPLGDSFLGAEDFTAPVVANTSFVGATVNTPLNESNLGTISGSGVYGGVETFAGQQANFLIRAVGVPEPAIAMILAAPVGGAMMRRRLRQSR